MASWVVANLSNWMRASAASLRESARGFWFCENEVATDFLGYPVEFSL